MNSSTRNLLAYLILGSTLLAVSACATTKGFGEDVENLGENIQEEAEEHD